MKSYNPDIMRFFKEKNIDYKKIKKNPESIIKSKKELDYIVYQNGQYKNEIKKEISIAYLIGSTELESKNILDKMNELYDSSKGLYSKRSLEYLKSDNPIEAMRESFSKEPILVEEIIKGKYIIAGNGRHRCNLLKLHYLNELQNCSSEQEKQILENKYIIPVRAKEIDVIKTYSKYVLRKINKCNNLYQDINNINGTGKSIVEDEFGKENYLTDKELINYVKSKINELSKGKIENDILEDFNNSEYLHEYITTYFSEMINEFKKI